MGVTIGVVVHTDRHAVFAEAAHTLTGTGLEWVVYRHEGEVRELVQSLLARRRVDGLLLGPVPYDACREVLPESMPVTVIRPAALDLALALYRARVEHPKRTTISIDTFDVEAVTEVTEAVGMTGAQVQSLPYVTGQDAAAIAEHHLSTLGRAGLVITARMAVAHALRGRVPLVEILPMVSTIRAELHRLALRLQTQHANAFRFSAGVFLVADRSREFDVDRSRVGLMNLLLNTPEFAEAWVENRGRRGLVVLAHNALFERVTHNWLTVPVLSQAEEKLGIKVAAGFGIGGSARTCITLAERAAARAEAEPCPAGYLIEDSGVIIGPMGQDSHPVEFTYRDHDDRIEQLARGVGLSPATLSRLAAIERNLRGKAISPSDLANALGITDPSGRRLIRKLHERGLVRMEGSAQTHRKGRPTKLYRLEIDQALDIG
jgi:DNA-binding MarR family transcriptional regulator/DNA-binding transcriptional ArsR family regulator